MSIKVMSQVWDSAPVGGSELLVLLALADYANDEGTSIYPAMRSVAKKARLSVDQARRVIHELVTSGVIELVEAGGWRNGRNRTNEYRIILEDVLASCKGGTRVDARGGTRADARTVLAPMQDDPSLIHHIDPPLEAESLAVPKVTPQQEMFGALCEAIGWDYKTLAQSDRAQVAQAVAILNKASYQVEDIRRFMVEVWFKDWRWTRDGAHPTLKQVRQEIGKIRSTVPAAAPEQQTGIDGFRSMLATQGITI